MSDLVSWLTSFVSNTFVGVSSGVNEWFPQVSSVFSGVPVVGDLLVSLSNSDVVLILLFGLLFLYASKASSLVLGFKVLCVVMILLLLFGVL